MGDNYCIMNLKKVNGSDNIKGLQAEANREHEDKDQYVNKVDLSRSYQNVDLVRSDDWQKSINDIIAESEVSVNKDSVLGITAVYTASPEWFEAHPSRQEQLAYFNDCLKFHEQHFGKVFNAVIHYDETTPHMQVISVPVIEVPKVENYWINEADGKPVTQEDEERWAQPKKRKQRRVLDENGNSVMSKGLNGARALGNQKKLSKLQDDFAAQVGKPYGLERGECRIDSKERVEHKTALQHEIKTLEQQKEEIKDEAKLEGYIEAKTDLDIERYLMQLEYDNTCSEMAIVDYEQTTTAHEQEQKSKELAQREIRLSKRTRAVWERENAVTDREQALEHDKAEIKAKKAEIDAISKAQAQKGKEQAQKEAELRQLADNINTARRNLADEKKRFMSLKTVTNKGNEMMNKQANMSKFSSIQQFMD